MYQSKPCKYVLSNERCPYGRKCRFAHGETREKVLSKHTIDGKDTKSTLNEKQLAGVPAKGETERNASEKENQTIINYNEEEVQVPESRNTPSAESFKQKKCYFYLRSHCRYGAKCKFYHPNRASKELFLSNNHSNSAKRAAGYESNPDHFSELKPVPISESKLISISESKPVRVSESKSKPVSITRHADVPRVIQHAPNPPPLTLGSFIRGPHVTRPHKKHKELESGSANLREVELEQLQVRFQAGEECDLLEKSREKITYVIQFSPSDQEWHGPSTLQLKVSFPEKYPNEFCHVELLPHQDLLPELVLHSNEAMEKYWTSNMLGGLMFRPFLRWWDKKIVDLLQTPFSKIAPVSEDEEASDNMASAGIEATSSELDEDVEKTVPILKSKKGTEIRLLGVAVGQTLGTAYWSTLNVVLSCSRCKHHRQVELKEESCSPVEVIFQSSPLAMTCLNCSSEVTSKGFFIDQPKDVYCHRCHAKVTFNATGVRFIQHQHTNAVSGGRADCEILAVPRKKATEDFKDGYPLPEQGLCQHYKKSHRWLRFPCCGRAFPCDVCHDAAQDHLMERATRMLCGYCSKEQTYAVNCARCGADLVSSKSSSHWEGGQGCRNRTKMGRLDKQKYKDSNLKTASKKTERVGKKIK